MPGSLPSSSIRRAMAPMGSSKRTAGNRRPHAEREVYGCLKRHLEAGGQTHTGRQLGGFFRDGLLGFLQRLIDRGADEVFEQFFIIAFQGLIADLAAEDFHAAVDFYLDHAAARIALGSDLVKVKVN